jgi:hypothetical protein
MTVGFGGGDFVAVLDKANQLRDRFANAPAQFKAISREYVRRGYISPKLIYFQTECQTLLASCEISKPFSQSTIWPIGKTNS